MIVVPFVSAVPLTPLFVRSSLLHEGAGPVAEHLNLYITGEWRPALDGARRELRCPADGQLVATAAEASTEDTARRDRGRARSLRQGRADGRNASGRTCCGAPPI